MQKEWIVAKTDNGEKSLIERLLAVRGITTKTEIKEFLNPLEMKLTEPTVFVDMAKSVERLAKAVDEKQKILVYGDFDADGITSTSVLLKTLRHLGAEVDYYIPDRETESHGMNTKTLVKLMTSKKPKVMITVDCGVSNVEEVKFLKSFGVDIIITDHHEAPEELPPAYAIINPKAQNSLDEKLPAKKIKMLTYLAGCGVAFKVAQALLNHYNKPEFVFELLPLVALGTIADIVPLLGENRYLVTKGLELISKGQHYGLTRLLESAGYNIENGITSENIAFGIAPRINATGRLDNVDTALSLLLSDNKTEIEMAVQTLNELNKVRQNLCESTFLEADEMYQKEGTDNNAIVLFSNKWNIGIIGIVASKFVEKYYKPTFIMNYNPETQQFRCSARSVKGINLYEVLDANSELFDGFGGHEMAAGFAFSGNAEQFNVIKETLNKTISEVLGDKVLKPFVNIDLELDEKDLDLTLVDEISKLEPFGASNPSPVFVVKNFTLKEKTLMGENKNHLRLKVQGQDALYTCVWWSRGDIPLVAEDKLDIAFSPKLNTFRDVTSLQLMVEDIHSDNLKEEKPENPNVVKVFDHRNKSDIFSQVEDYVRTSKMNIVVYAENKDVINSLKPYKCLSDAIVNRETLKKADSIMFFDYPPSEELFDKIVEFVQPRHIHYMACNVKNLDELEIIKTLSGMIRFTCNNKNGEFNLAKSASFLSLTIECIEALLDVLEQCKMIKIVEKNIDNYELEFLGNVELSHITGCLQYNEFKNQLEEIIDCKNNFLSKEID